MLVDFLDMIAIRYQLDNVVNIIEGLKNKVDIELLMNNIDPLGYFPEMRNIKVDRGLCRCLKGMTIQGCIEMY